MPKALITGAGGFIGSKAVEVFRAGGWEVRATDLPRVKLDAARALGAEVLPADLLVAGQIPPLLQGIDAVVHFAALFNFRLGRKVVWQANVETVENLCRASLQSKLRSFVHLSSVGVYGRPSVLPCPEDGPKNPRNPYERTKLDGEDIALGYWRRHGLPVKVLRPTLVYGPGCRYGYSMIVGLFSIVKAFRKPLPMLRHGPTAHFIHSEDVARAALHLASIGDGVGTPYNLADDNPASFRDFYQTMSEILEMDSRLLVYPDWLYKLCLKVLSALPRPCIDRVNEEINRWWDWIVRRYQLSPGFRPTIDREWFYYMGAHHYYTTNRMRSTGFRCKFPHMREGLRDMIGWYRAHRWIP